VTAAVVVSILLPRPGTAQYFEPAARRPGVELPPAARARQAEEAARLGIVPVERLLVDGGVHIERLGTMPVLVIPALFEDSPEPHIAVEEIRQEVFEGPSDGGTLPDFYREASGGRFEFEGTVVPWVRTSVTIFEAAGELDGHGYIGERRGEYIVEALRLADETVDFADFDGDGDGTAEAVAIEFLEPAGSCGGPGIWPHLSTTRVGTEDGKPFASEDLGPDGEPIEVDAYIVESVSDCTGDDLQGISVIAHELGHILGLPDYYRAITGPGHAQRHWNVGCFGLMAGGSWGCGSGPKENQFGPVQLSPLSRRTLGWLEPTEITRAEDQEFVLEPSLTSGDALFVSLGPGSPESFQIEYRTRTGFDDELPAEGVLVYHHDAFDPRRTLRPEPGEIPPWPYHLVEADGDDALRKLEADGGNRGVAGDVFSVDGSEASLDASTTPSTRTHSGEPSTLTIHSIRVEGGVARVRLTVGSDLVAMDREVPRSWSVLLDFEGSFGVGGGVAPYDARIGDRDGPLPEGIEIGAEGNRVTLRGMPVQAGNFEAIVTVEDAEGALLYETLELGIADQELAEADLMEGVVEGAGALSALQLRYLDLSGNGDGAFDVGDLRAYVQRTR